MVLNRTKQTKKQTCIICTIQLKILHVDEKSMSSRRQTILIENWIFVYIYIFIIFFFYIYIHNTIIQSNKIKRKNHFFYQKLKQQKTSEWYLFFFSYIEFVQ